MRLRIFTGFCLHDKGARRIPIKCIHRNEMHAVRFNVYFSTANEWKQRDLVQFEKCVCALHTIPLPCQRRFTFLNPHRRRNQRQQRVECVQQQLWLLSDYYRCRRFFPHNFPRTHLDQHKKKRCESCDVNRISRFHCLIRSWTVNVFIILLIFSVAKYPFCPCVLRSGQIKWNKWDLKGRLEQAGDKRETLEVSISHL